MDLLDLNPGRVELGRHQPNGAGLIMVIAETDTPDPDREDFCGWGTHQTCRAALWKDEKLTALPTLGGNNSTGIVMNERGQQ